MAAFKFEKFEILATVYFLESVSASEAEISTFQKIGGRGYKRWGF